jgi:hypothetical protein
MNVGPIAPDVDELAVMLEAPELDARSRLHGTATCFPELDRPEAVAEVDVLGVVGELVELVPAEPLSEMIANSTFPELGLMIASWIVPSVSPDELCTLQLLSLLAWTACCDVRPVALKPLLLLL